ncbi:MAG: hypothetical protein WCA27_19335 [Candidatus Sulfotelmatobacter sp.]
MIEQQIDQLDQEIAGLLRQHQDAVERLAEVPGLGVDSAQQIIAEVGAKVDPDYINYRRTWERRSVRVAEWLRLTSDGVSYRWEVACHEARQSLRYSCFAPQTDSLKNSADSQSQIQPTRPRMVRVAGAVMVGLVEHRALPEYSEQALTQFALWLSSAAPSAICDPDQQLSQPDKVICIRENH